MSWITFFIIFLDQITKLWSEKLLRYSPKNLGIFKLTYAENTGVAFGILKNYSFVHGIISFIIITIILFVYRVFLSKHRNILNDIAVSFICGGAAGNMIDRIRFGYVVDMIYVPYFSVFNIADSFVTIGGLLLVISILKGSTKSETKYYGKF
ncbi:MAG TPA: signal peptidase II [Tepiditoga sp.]|nr:signal peptidase II [Tepiditoga sp.]